MSLPDRNFRTPPADDIDPPWQRAAHRRAQRIRTLLFVLELVGVLASVTTVFVVTPLVLHAAVAFVISHCSPPTH